MVREQPIDDIRSYCPQTTCAPSQTHLCPRTHLCPLDTLYPQRDTYTPNKCAVNTDSPCPPCPVRALACDVTPGGWPDGQLCP